MKQTFLFVLAIMFTASSFSQVSKKPSSVSSIEDDIVGLASGKSYNHTFDNRYEGVKGTPFLNEDWENGGIYLLSGTFYNNINLKLDVYNDDLIYETRDGNQVLLDKSLIDYFILTGKNGNQIRKFKVVRTPDNPIGNYYEILYDKGSSLMVKYEKDYVRADYQKAINTNRRYDEFKTDKSYYLLTSNTSEPVKMKLNKKNAKELFGNQPEAMQFISDNNLRMKNVNDWIELLKFIDSK